MKPVIKLTQSLEFSTSTRPLLVNPYSISYVRACLIGTGTHGSEVGLKDKNEFTVTESVEKIEEMIDEQVEANKS